MDGLAELDALSRQKIMQRLTLQYITGLNTKCGMNEM